MLTGWQVRRPSWVGTERARLNPGHTGGAGVPLALPTLAPRPPGSRPHCYRAPLSRLARTRVVHKR